MPGVTEVLAGVVPRSIHRRRFPALHMRQRMPHAQVDPRADQQGDGRGNGAAPQGDSHPVAEPDDLHAPQPQRRCQDHAGAGQFGVGADQEQRKRPVVSPVLAGGLALS
jgi:hypothetical protein